MALYPLDRSLAHIGKIVDAVGPVRLFSAHGKILESVVTGKIAGPIFRNVPDPFRQLDPGAVDESLDLRFADIAFFHFTDGIRILAAGADGFDLVFDSSP